MIKVGTPSETLMEVIVYKQKLLTPKLYSYTNTSIITQKYWCDLNHFASILPPYKIAMWVDKYLPVLLQGLNNFHIKGLCHNDIWGKNILVDWNYNPVYCDFASTTIFHHNKRGHPDYRAPEVIAGELSSPASDRWSLGCTMYYILTKEKYNAKCLVQQIEGISQTTKDLISTLLSPYPKDRQPVRHIGVTYIDLPWFNNDTSETAVQQAQEWLMANNYNFN